MWLISLNKISWVFGTEMVMGLSWCSDSQDTKTLTSDHVHSAAETELEMQQVQPFQLIRRTSSHRRQRFLCPLTHTEHAWPPKMGVQCVGSSCHSTQSTLASHWHFIPPLSCRLSACSPTHRAPPAQRKSQRHRLETQQFLFILSL